MNPTDEHIHTTIQKPLLSTCLEDLDTPGVIVVVDPEEAESLGAFQETALSLEDAWESNLDMGEDRYGE